MIPYPSLFQSIKILVTGATGFIGQYVLKGASRKGIQLDCLYRSDIPRSVASLDEVNWIKSDLNFDFNSINTNYDTILHCACIGVSPQKALLKEYFETNVLKSLIFIENGLLNGVKKIVSLGSCLEYGKSGEKFEFIPTTAPLLPTDNYGASKAAFTMGLDALEQNYTGDFRVLRPFHIYGEGQYQKNFWPHLRKTALSGKDFEMTKGEQIRDYLHVSEVADLIIGELLQDTQDSCFMIKNLGSGKPISMKEFAHEQWSQFGAKGKLKLGSVPYRKNEIMRYVPKL